jgi:hypothetical protein
MMNTKKLIFSLMIAFAITFMQIGAVAAQEPIPPTGTVESIALQTDATNGETTVLVTYTDNLGVTQSANLSLDTAVTLGLVTLDPTTGKPVVNDSAVGQPVTIDPTTVPPDSTTTEEEQHPVGSRLSDFFGELLGVDYDSIMAAHENGTGFGVIAQALWMTNELNGDANTFQMIVEAKKTGDYSGIILPDGSTSTATNWGQFKKDVTDKGDKDNLGSVMSGEANNGQTQDGTTTLGGTAHGNSGNQSNNGRGNNDQDKGKDKDKGKGKP